MTDDTYNRAGHGIKHDQGKLQWHLLPLQFLRGTVRVLMFGAKKYSAHNWRAGMPHTQTYNAAIRHLDAWMAGENLDAETGQHPVDHALCELLFLRAHIEEHPELDDRFSARQEKQPAAAALERLGVPQLVDRAP